jgi:hypothetical protein
MVGWLSFDLYPLTMTATFIGAFKRKSAWLLAAWLLSGLRLHAEGLDWPASRLLPAFPSPAATIDCIDVTHVTGPERDLFASLEGIVNRSQPRIACVGVRTEEGKFAWLKIHRLPYQVVYDGYSVVAKYKNEVTGLVVTDPNVPDTLNLATTLAGLNDELICDPDLLAVLTNAPYSLQIKDDLRGRFANKSQVYDFIRTNCWPRCTHRVLAGMGDNAHGSLRDYLIAIKSAVVWFDPKSTADADALTSYFSDMKPAHCLYMGWWPDEAAGLKYAGQFGIPVLASDFFENSSLFSGVVQTVTAPPIPSTPPLENKIYVAFIFSDGDNVQYMQHHMKDAWEKSARGSVPMGWTVSPLAVDLDPAMLNYFYLTATTNDCLVSGPSGAGYARLNFWNQDNLSAFAKNTDSYLRRSGIRVITVWNKVTDAVANSFAADCPTLLGVTDQEGGGYLAIHGKLPTVGFAAKAAYAGKVSEIQDAIARDAKKWNGTAPVFIAVQADSWFLGAADFQAIAATLDKNRFVVVRPDHLFLLLKQSLAAGTTPMPK